MTRGKAVQAGPGACFRWVLLVAVLGVLVVAAAPLAHAQIFKTLYSFGSAPDGAFSGAPLVLDANGNLYGTTPVGGTSSSCGGGCGTVFSVTPAGVESVIYSFKGNSGDGASPNSGLVDWGGALYGTTRNGGVHYNYKYRGFGTAFVVSLSGSESVICSFTSGVNAFPLGLIRNSQGFLAGTTAGVGTKGGGREYGGAGFYSQPRRQTALQVQESGWSRWIRSAGWAGAGCAGEFLRHNCVRRRRF